MVRGSMNVDDQLGNGLMWRRNARTIGFLLIEPTTGNQTSKPSDQALRVK